MAEEASLPTRERECRRLRGDGEITGGDKLAAGRRGQRVHAGDDRLGNRLHGVHHRRADLEQVLRGGKVGAGHVAEVVTGREHRAHRGEHDAERVARAGLVERGGHLEHHVEGEGVALLRPVEGDGDDIAAAVEQQVLVGHG